jgi:hypothetical protein
MTVGELKRKMTFEEAVTWGLYRKRHGPFTVQARTEYGFALLAAIQTNTKDLRKFIPWHVEQEIEMTPKQMLTGLQAVSAKNRARSN